MIPGAVAVEGAVEGIVDSKKKSGDIKAKAVTDAAIAALQVEGEIAGRQYATPRVVRAIRGVNDAQVELLDALAEAHEMNKPAPAENTTDGGLGSLG
jgi:hypothetical protein